jgi:hypothetical protein
MIRKQDILDRAVRRQRPEVVLTPGPGPVYCNYF